MAAPHPTDRHGDDPPEGSPGDLLGPARVAAAAQVFVDDLEALELADDDAHHLARVLRLRAGEPVVAADGAGSWRLCRYRGGSARAGLEEAGPLSSTPMPSAPVTIAFVPVKGERPEWVVQKATELGADRIVVLRAARSVVRWEGERGTTAVERLAKVAREAAAQSRRPRLPAVQGVVSLAELAQGFGPGRLALAEAGGDPPDGGILAVAVGPEGGWADEELGQGLPCMGLGPAVLRAETAAVAAAGLLCALRDGLVRPSASRQRARAPGQRGLP
ncbi:MAG: 16S rRNA (uracil(1498)-N(3))-methyltransferase [Acidimicrobiales bacterium]